MLRTSATRVLDARDLEEARALVQRDPISDVFVASRLDIGGLDPWRLGAEVWGYGERGRLEALCYSGANLVPVQARGEAVRAFAERARRQGRRCSSVVGPSSAVQELWQLLQPSWGWAREADLGVASGNGKGQIFVKGEVIKTVPEAQIVETLIEEALRLAESYSGPAGEATVST